MYMLVSLYTVLPSVCGTVCLQYALLSLHNGGGTALMRVSEKGHMECVKLLLDVDGGADVNMQSKVSVISYDLL